MNLKNDQILKKYIVTEKASDLSANFNKYTFHVHPKASAPEVKSAIEAAFDVKVTKVNTFNKKPQVKADRYRRGQTKVIRGYKKAIVTLEAGDKIEII